MAIVTKVEPLEKDIELLIRQDLSPEAQSEMLAGFARETLLSAQETNQEALGRIPLHDTYVDGVEGASENAVRPNGTIIYEFNLYEGLFAWIGEQLVLHSPVKTGRYANSFAFFADGVEVDPSAVVPPAEEYVFINTQPYSRKIERGLSDQAPEGVFQVVAALAQRRFGNLAKVTFSFRSPINGNQSNVSRIGPLLVKRNSSNGQFLTGSHVRAGSQQETAQRQPAIIIYPR